MERKKPDDFPIWMQTLRHMVAFDAWVRVHYDTCGKWRAVDLLQLLCKVQRPDLADRPALPLPSNQVLGMAPATFGPKRWRASCF